MPSSASRPPKEEKDTDEKDTGGMTEILVKKNVEVCLVEEGEGKKGEELKLSM